MTGRPYGQMVLVISRCRQTIETAQQLSDKDMVPSAAASLASATVAEHLQLKLRPRKL